MARKKDPDQVAKVKKLRAQGLTFPVIAERLGISRRTAQFLVAEEK